MNEQQPNETLWLLRLLGWIARSLARAIRGEVIRRTGGPARARVITLFAIVLALNGADASTIGAIAPQLESGLHIGNTELGLLSSVSLLVGAIFTIPVGLLVDRAKRMPLLAASIVLWSLASLFSGFTGSFSSLLLTRLALGAVAASAGPAIASLTGDYFAPDERGSSGPTSLWARRPGTAFGFIVSGFMASLIDWRALSWCWPFRASSSRESCGGPSPSRCEGGRAISKWGPSTSARQSPRPPFACRTRRSAASSRKTSRPGIDAAREAAHRAGAVPNPRLVLHEDPRQMGLAPSIRYIFSIPSNLLMIVGSSLGYFYFAGLQTFALLFVKGHYHAGQATAELALALLVVGAVIGTRGRRTPD